MNTSPELDRFWKKFVEVEHGIVTCPVCRKYSGKDPASPQLSWAGSEYRPGGVMFVLQNPGVTPKRWDYAGRDQRLADLLRSFRSSPTLDSYRALVSEVHAQMQGLIPADTYKWPKWVHPISKCIMDCLTIDHVVWVNVVKHRTPGDAIKDRPTIAAEQEHGLRQHLAAELAILRPRMVVAVGVPAAKAMAVLEGQWRIMPIKAQGALNEEAFAFGNYDWPTCGTLFWPTLSD